MATPLVAWGTPQAGETADLAADLAAYRQAADPLRTAPLEQFLATHPHSAYRVSLWLDIGLAHEHAGDYAAAIADLNRSLAAAGPAAHLGYSPTEAVVDQTLAELLTLQTGFGNADQVAALLADPRVTADGGVLSAPMLTARRSLWAMRHTPQSAFICGAIALEQVLVVERIKPSRFTPLAVLKAKDGGLSLSDLQYAAGLVGVPMRAIHVAHDAPIPVPSVMHWTMDHYVAVIGMQNGRYVVNDPAFGRQFMMSRTVLENNSSGFYLVPAQVTPDPGWRLASASETAKIRGGGITDGPVKNEPNPGSCPAGCPHFTIALMTASLRISDNPVGYHPPVGPDAEFVLSYNQQDQSLSASGLAAPNYGNPGPQWTDDWLSYVVDDPTTPGSNVSLVYAGGGFVNYSGYSSATGAFTPELAGGAILTRVTSTEYIRTFPDGSENVYAQPNGNTVYPRLLFLTKIVDKSGNALTLSYDPNMRLVSVKDAIGQVTTLQYNNQSFPLLLTSVTDPFGRKATIGYDSSGRLNALTDAVGMQSSFTYSSGAVLPTTFISKMTTPYGASSFAAVLGTTSNPYPYWLTATDPLGNTERVETDQDVGYPQNSDEYAPTLVSDPNYQVPTLLNTNLLYRNTYFWDKATYATITDKSTLGSTTPNLADYEKAVVYHWQHDTYSFYNTPSPLSSGVLESLVYPLERNLKVTNDISRIWFIYANTGEYGGTNQSYFTSSTSYLPIQIARVLPNGATQLTRIDRNANSNITTLVDPLGRQTNYTYAPNGIDLTQASQKNPGSSGGSDLLGTYTYNSQHEPLTVTDASGNTTTYTYNSAGQVLTATNALNQKTTYTYSGGYLMTVTDANNQTHDSYTYDSVGRIASWTDSQGYMLSYNYDNLDRLTKITYPDSTTTQYKYTNLDITKITDRLGRVTTYTYDANRNLTAVTDPLNRTVKYGYDADGRLISLTDADGQTTSWTRDIEGRVTKKTYADGTSVSYAYDISNRLISRTDALNQTTNYTYGTDNRITKVAYTNPVNPTPTVSLTWDSVYPRLDAMTDGTGKTKFTYVAAGENGALQLSSETGPIGSPAKYVYNYDELGRIEQMIVAGTIQDTISYDAIGRDVGDATPLGQINTTYVGETDQVNTVTALGQSISGNPGLTTYGYLPNSGDRRLNTITYNAAPNSNETITTDDAYRVTARTDGTGKVESYTYDNADRLSYGTVTAPTAYTETYGLNNADFISSKSGEPVTANNWAATNTGSVNAIGTLTPTGGAGRAYAYDANGNVRSDGVNTYTWDAENRLLTVTNIATGHLSSFTYDGLGRRVAITETTGGVATKTGYLWCGTTLCAAYNAGGITTARYQAEGEVQYSGGTATPYYYATDHLGSVTATTSATGTTLGTLATDAYGLTLSQTGTAPTFGYAGMFLHAASGIYLTKNRAYDPYSGRWLSRDPAGEIGGINLFGYVGQTPTNGVDPLGLFNFGDAVIPGLIELGGGGPEDPIADAAAIAELDSELAAEAAEAADQAAADEAAAGDDGPAAENPGGGNSGDDEGGECPAGPPAASGGGAGGGSPPPPGAAAAPEEPQPGGMKRATYSDLQKAAQQDGYKNVEDWKQQELQLDSKSDIMKDRKGNLYSVPRKGSGIPQPLYIQLLP